MQVKSNSYRSFVYYVNYILRNVITVRRIGLIHNCSPLKQWIIKNRFELIFEFSSSQISKIDLNFLSNLVTQMVIGIDPFNGLSDNQIEDALNLIDVGIDGAILAIPTSNNHELRPKVVYSNSDWNKILEKIGNVIQISRCEQFTIFLITKYDRNSRR